MEKDIRWIQRFDNYCKAVAQMNQFIEKENLNDLEKQGLIQCFEYTFELGWNVMKDFLIFKGFKPGIGSRDAISISFENGLISDGFVWLEMVKDRNLSVHTYNQNTTLELCEKILHTYSYHFQLFKDEMEKLK